MGASRKTEQFWAAHAERLRVRSLGNRWEPPSLLEGACGPHAAVLQASQSSLHAGPLFQETGPCVRVRTVPGARGSVWEQRPLPSVVGPRSGRGSVLGGPWESTTPGGATADGASRLSSRHQRGPCGGRGDRGPKATVRHLGKHGQCGQSDGQHRRSGQNPGELLAVPTVPACGRGQGQPGLPSPPPATRQGHLAG